MPMFSSPILERNMSHVRPSEITTIQFLQNYTNLWSDYGQHCGQASRQKHKYLCTFYYDYGNFRNT